MTTSPLALWHDEHIKFVGLLDLLQREIDTFRGGETPHYDLMIDILNYLRDYADCVHHPREDIAFRQLEVRCTALAPQISRLLQEHRVITWAGEELLTQLKAAAADVVLPRSALETAASRYIRIYRDHLNAEESQILPMARVLLVDEDWALLADSEAAVADPLFGSQVAERFKRLRRQIDLQSPRARSQALYGDVRS